MFHRIRSAKLGPVVVLGCLLVVPCVLEATTITFSFLTPGEPAGIAVDADGKLYVAGRNTALKIDPATSKVLYSTPLLYSSAKAIAVDQSGNAYLTGLAGLGFPTTASAYQKTPAGITDVFVAKLGPDGRLVYATFLGGRNLQEGRSIAVDGAGNAYVVGTTSSDDFPVTPGALQTSGVTLTDPGGFVSKLSADGSRLIYSTYLRNAVAEGVAVDSSGNAYVTGHTYTEQFSTSPPDFPTTPGAFQPRFPAVKCPAGVPDHLCSAGFVIKLNAAGSAPVFSTFLGSTTEYAGHAIGVDSSGNCYVAGSTSASNFPTKNAFQASIKGIGPDAFLAKLDNSGASLLYSTFFGGSRDEVLRALAIDGAGNAYLAGRTLSADLPLRNAMLATLNSGSSVRGVCGTQTPSGGFIVEDCADAFLAKFDGNGSLAYSTYFGGLSEEYAVGVATDAQGVAYVIGQWGSGTAVFPAVGPLQNSDGAGIFVIRVAESAPLPLFSFDSVVNAASLVRGTAPGGLATVFGTGLAKSAGIIAASGTPLPRQLDGLSVEIDGVAAPLLAVAKVNGQEQINFQVPSTSRGWPMVVNNNGVRSLPIHLATGGKWRPGVFTVEGGLAAIQHSSDFQLVTANSPAARSEIIVIYATGLGVVDPDPGDGNAAAASPLPVTKIQPAVTIGGKAAEVLFSGLAPGFVGLNQVNVRVPESTPSGSVNLVISVSLPSQSTFASKPVTLFVR